MAVVRASRRRKKKPAAKSRRRRRSKPAAAPRRRRRRVKAKVVSATKRRRRRVTREATVVQAPRRRRRRTRKVRAWRGNSAGHATAARKGWRKRKAKRAAPKRRRRSRRRSKKMNEALYAAAPRRRRRKARRARESTVVRAPRRTRRRSSRRVRSLFESRGSKMGGGDVAIAMVSGGLGFILADGLDRFMATYSPKFTSDGTGALANTLNVAATPDWKRLAASGGALAVPLLGAHYSRGMVRTSMQGAALGAGISALKTLWNNVLMPLLAPKDTAAMRGNFIARLYPAEVAASINLKAGQRTGSGALSGHQLGVGDVGPFALGGDSPYPDAAQALRRDAGVQDQFPTVQNTWGTGSQLQGPGSDYPTAAQAMGTGAPGPSGDAYMPGPPPGPGPGPQAKPHKDPACGCIGDANSAFLGDQLPEQPFYR